ncbi:MAG: thymidine kinase [Bacteroidetes bacterium]|nr:MAG: thymidine kinase [Bacteroidota bacterium]TNE99771.1 MAG: thymidine kinase [Bacteroidota bacterium]
MFLEHLPVENRNYGWIEVICGSMFSGKTEELIRRLKRVEFANQSLLLVKPLVDNRYHKKNVVSHQGRSFDATTVENAEDILKKWTNERVVAIDEAQFFDSKLTEVVNKLASKGVRVIIAGLDMDFRGVPFGPMPELLCIAEYVTKVHAICVSCGNLAQFSHRLNKEEGQVLVGADQEYRPLCRHCYTTAINQ